MIPNDFQITCSKVKVKPLFSAHCVVCSISFDPFTWSIPILVQGLPSISRWFLLIFRSHVQRSRSNHSSQPTVLSAQYLLTPSLDEYQTWCRGCPQWVDDPYWFSEILAFLPCEYDNVIFYSYLIMFSSALCKVPNTKCLVHISSNLESYIKGGIYVSETFLV